MNWFNILFPVLKDLEDLIVEGQTTSLDTIVSNNIELAKELEGKPPMNAQQIKEYVNNKEL
jgi:hypothetical protein